MHVIELVGLKLIDAAEVSRGNATTSSGGDVISANSVSVMIVSVVMF